MCMESPLVTMLRRLSKDDLNNIIECLESGVSDKKNSEKAGHFQETLMKVRNILAAYEAHEA